MTKALLKKQMMEVFAWVYRDRKSGKNRNIKGLVGFSLLYIFIFGYLGYIFFIVADSLCAPLVSVGFDWLYMALMSLIGIALGVFGSVFNTYASLYQAKDNDLLLSMPIPATKILIIRLAGVYVIGLMYELIVMIPTLIVFFINAKISVLGYIFSLLIPFVLSVFVLTLSCVLGFVVALISSKLKNKNIITVVLSLAFIIGYYYVYMQAYKLLKVILANPAALGNKIKSILYPFYHLGLGCEGNIVSMLIFVVIVMAFFALVYFILSFSFLKIATTNKGAAKVKYKEKATRAGSIKSALLKKELRRFLGSPTYMLNCGLGIIIMIVAAAALIYKASWLTSMLSVLYEGAGKIIPLLGVAAVCMMTTMNDITAPSVSLEGKNIWLVQSLPVSAFNVLMAKLKLHLYLTIVPAMLLTASFLWVVKPAWYFIVLSPVTVIGFVLLIALAGLFLNLKSPNLNWTDETVPVKQSMSVMLCLFGGWGIVFALGGIYVALIKYIEPIYYLMCITVLLFVFCAILLRWIKTKGAKIFETL